MNKNSQIHFNLDTESYEKIKEEARERKMSVSELCRVKVLGDSQLDRIEGMLVGMRGNR